jgi:hypothetical protein
MAGLLQCLSGSINEENGTVGSFTDESAGAEYFGTM